MKELTKQFDLTVAAKVGEAKANATTYKGALIYLTKQSNDAKWLRDKNYLYELVLKEAYSIIESELNSIELLSSSVITDGAGGAK